MKDAIMGTVVSLYLDKLSEQAKIEKKYLTKITQELKKLRFEGITELLKIDEEVISDLAKGLNYEETRLKTVVSWKLYLFRGRDKLSFIDAVLERKNLFLFYEKQQIVKFSGRKVSDLYDDLGVKVSEAITKYIQDMPF